MNKQQKKRAAVEEYRQVISSRKKPNMRITKKRRRRLLIGAIAVDVLEAFGGTVVPVIGDIASPFIIDWIFKKWFQRYNVNPDEFRSSGGIGKTGYFLLQSFDTLIGFTPVVGDAIDLVMASWTYKIYTSTKDLRAKDKTRIANYRQWRKNQKQRLRQNIRQIERSQY